MPIYEYHCNACDRDFEELVSRPADADQVTCVHCASDAVKRKISTVGCCSTRSSFSGGGCGSGFS